MYKEASMCESFLSGSWGKSCLNGTYSLKLEYGGNKCSDSADLVVKV